MALNYNSCLPIKVFRRLKARFYSMNKVYYYFRHSIFSRVRINTETTASDTLLLQSSERALRNMDLGDDCSRINNLFSEKLCKTTVHFYSSVFIFSSLSLNNLYLLLLPERDENSPKVTPNILWPFLKNGSLVRIYTLDKRENVVKE